MPFISKEDLEKWTMTRWAGNLTRPAGEFGLTLEEIKRANINKLEQRDHGDRVG